MLPLNAYETTVPLKSSAQTSQELAKNQNKTIKVMAEPGNYILTMSPLFALLSSRVK